MRRSKVNRPLRVLFFAECWGKGGIESFILNSVKAFEDEAVDFSVFTMFSLFEENRDERLLDLHVPLETAFNTRPSRLQGLSRGTKALKDYLSGKEFDVIHINVMNGFGFLYAQIAKEAGVPVRIVHSHNSSSSSKYQGIKQLINGSCRIVYGSAATACLACSDLAGEYLFNSDSFEVIKNSVDTKKFQFDALKRAAIRKQLGVATDATLVGFVGRLVPQKNALFALRVFVELLDRGRNAHFLLIGSGSESKQIEDEITLLNLQNRVTTIPHTNSIESFLSAMDLLLVPSSFEGLPLITVEAQASGLPCLMSEAIPEEAVVIDAAKSKALADGCSSWATASEGILSNESNTAREMYAEQVATAGFGFSSLKESLRSVYSPGGSKQ